jgi:hypothetical protein
LSKPGAASLIHEPARWRRYVADSLIETSNSRDVLLLTRVDKPALLRRLFDLACRHSGQILSYTKMLGQLQDAGNTTTPAHYLDLLAGAWLVRGLQKFTGDAARSRGSSPKLQVLDTALMTAMSGLSFDEAGANRVFWGLTCPPISYGIEVESGVNDTSFSRVLRTRSVERTRTVRLPELVRRQVIERAVRAANGYRLSTRLARRTNPS